MKTTQQVLVSVSLVWSLLSMASAQSLTSTLPTVTAGSVSSQPILPSCAYVCTKTAEYTLSCAPGDQACFCHFSTSIQNSIYKCLKTSTCGESDASISYEYYPNFCKSLSLAIATDVPTATATAAESTQVSSTTSSSSTNAEGQNGAAETGASDSDQNLHGGLQLPAILGIVFAVAIMFMGVGGLMVWSFLRRRQVLRRPRMDLSGEFGESKPRPPRSKSIHSEFMVQPSPVEKNVATFGRTLSRSSTLVAPPPIAKDEKRSSEEKRNSARSKALRKLLGHDGLRSSFRSSRCTSSSKQPSLTVPPLDIRKSQESQLRVSKF